MCNVCRHQTYIYLSSLLPIIAYISGKYVCMHVCNACMQAGFSIFSYIYIGFSGSCGNNKLNRFFNCTRYLENLSSGEKRAVAGRGGGQGGGRGRWLDI